MKKRLFVLVILIAGTMGMANAQFFRLGLKVGYSTASIDELINNVSTEVQNANVDFLRQCDAGLMLRLNFGSRLYVQPEANFSISSVWSGVDSTADFFSTLSSAFDSLQSVNLSVPILVGFKIIDIENFLALRAFAGPEFYTSFETVSNGSFNFENYTVVGGLSIDLINFIYVDARVNYSLTSGDLFYKLGVGLMF